LERTWSRSRTNVFRFFDFLDFLDQLFLFVQHDDLCVIVDQHDLVGSHFVIVIVIEVDFDFLDFDTRRTIVNRRRRVRIQRSFQRRTQQAELSEPCAVSDLLGRLSGSFDPLDGVLARVPFPLGRGGTQSPSDVLMVVVSRWWNCQG
jgi:hypothetical protein